MKKILAISALALSMSSAFAVTAQSNVYVGPSLGWSFASSPENTTVSASSHTNENFTYGLKVGYAYALNPNFLTGVELGYFNFGQTIYDNVATTATSGKMNSNGLQILLTGTYLMNNGLGLFVKAGTIDEHTAAEPIFAQATSNGSNPGQSAWIPAAAIGVLYAFNQKWDASFEYEHTFGEDWNTSGNLNRPMTQNVFMLGVNRHFGM